MRMGTRHRRSSRLVARASESGATATEYLILVMLVALAIIVGARFFGTVLNDEMSDAGQSVLDGG